jgi:hypothetical protein
MADIMSKNIWMKETKRGLLTPRSKQLTAIDDALDAYHGSQNPINLGLLRKMIENWMKSKGSGWRKSTRNSRGTVSKLYKQVCSKFWDKQYTAIPKDNQWQEDTKAGLDQRANDRILLSIDKFIYEANKTNNKAVITYLKTQLFFTTDTWLRLEKKGAENIDPARYLPVYALFKYIAGQLCKLWDVTVNVLPQKIEEKFGQEISTYGRNKDKELTYDPQKPLPKVKYLTRLEAKKYELVFGNDRRAYQYAWWDPEMMEKWELVPADSSRSPGLKDGPAELPVFTNNLCGYSMSMDRRFYIGPHRAGFDGASSNFYHSSYLAGQTVLCAGEMKIINGIITEVTNDSGHYQPSLTHLVNVLETLSMYGVDVINIDVGWKVKTTPRPITTTVKRKPDPMFETVYAKGGYILKSRGNLQCLTKAQNAFNKRQPNMPRPSTLECPQCNNKFVTPNSEFRICPHCKVQLKAPV